VTMAAALASLFTGRRVRNDTAMTGEITLSGLVFPVGGIKEKVLAAHRAGIKRIILPAQNESDIEEIPADVRGELEFILARTVKDVLTAALEPAPAARDGESADKGQKTHLPQIDGRSADEAGEPLIAKKK
ncbi:MAG: endopeptidase La, partial [Blastocatellia bacterium]